MRSDVVLPVVNLLVLDRRSGPLAGAGSVTTVAACGESQRLVFSLSGVALGSQSFVRPSRQVVTVGGSATVLLQRLIELARAPPLKMDSPEGRNYAGSSRAPLRHARRTHTIWQCWCVPALTGLLPPPPRHIPDQAALRFTALPAAGRRRRSLTSTRVVSASRPTWIEAQSALPGVANPQDQC